MPSINSIGALRARVARFCRRLSPAIPLSIFLGLALAGAGCGKSDGGTTTTTPAAPAAPPEPGGEVLSVSIAADSFLVKGEMDAGYSVTGVVANRGPQKMFLVRAIFSCSEGEYERTRTVLLERGETNSVVFQFAEPTISSTDPKAIISITPK